MLPYTTSLTRGQGAAGVSQLQRSHRRRRGEVPERLAGRRPLGLGEAVGGRDDDEQSPDWIGLARDSSGAVRETDAREREAEVLEVLCGKTLSTPSMRLVDMDFLEDGILSRASRDTFFCRLTF